MKLIKIAFALFALLATTASAQMLIEVPTIEKDANGLSVPMDFAIDLKGVSDKGLEFSQFKDKPLVVFFFSAKCPHCIRAYPHVELMQKEFAEMGMTFLAIASGSNQTRDVKKFIDDQQASLPFFIDSDRAFAGKYKITSVPTTFLVNSKGEFIRYNNFSKEKIDLEIAIKDMVKE
jgi:thiol-disulfide isomerase/thioredoxin